MGFAEVFSFIGGGEKKEAHGRITRASLQMNQIFVYLRDHLLIDPKLSMAYSKIMSQPFQPPQFLQVRRYQPRIRLSLGYLYLHFGDSSSQVIRDPTRL
jgi:hypothetical protein